MLEDRKKGIFGKLSQRVSDALMMRPTIDEDFFEELEEILITSDIGMETTMKIVETLRVEVQNNNMTKPGVIKIRLGKIIADTINKGEAQKLSEESPLVILMIGINGGGKTTSIGKLAYKLKKEGRTVMLAAADTFRAGAVEQLTTWAQRLKIDIVTGKPESDPASVAYDGMKKAKQDNVDLVIVDTAGRLQTKNNLMAELAKIKRVMSKEIPEAPHDTFLIIDATTGQNGVVQAKAFKEVTDLTGIVITKMDGTSKGGIILAIRDELGVPVRFIGLGEKMDDLEEFDLDKYLYGLCVENE